MTIRALCFDLDGTLLNEGGLEHAISRACEAISDLKPDIEAARLSSINHQVFEEHWRETADAFVMGTRSGDEISREVWRLALARIGIDEPAIAETAFDIFTREATISYRLYEDALPVLELLGSRIPLAVITNGASDVQRRKLVATGIESRFRAIMVSGEHGTPKPDPRIFLRAAELLGVEPDATLHVGDLLEPDVSGAIGAGMTAVWLNRDGRVREETHPVPHHEITSLSELPGLLESL